MKRVFDMSVLIEYVGNDILIRRRLLADYLQATSGTHAELRAAISGGDYGLVAAIAHKLKSSSRLVGALPLADLCADLEAVGLAGNVAGFASRLEPFETTLDATRSEISAALQNSLPA